MTTSRSRSIHGARAALCALLVAAVVGGCGGEEEEEDLALEQEPVIFDDMVLLPPGAGADGTRQTFGPSGPTVLYLNFDGATISKGFWDDSAKNKSVVGSGTIPPFPGSGSDRSAVASRVKQLFVAYNISIVTTRPAAGDYDMAVIGGEASDLGITGANASSGGLAPLDCGNSTPDNIGFVYALSIKKAMSFKFVETVAVATAHEMAHTYGLPHSDDGCDVMSYGSCWGSKSFKDKTMGMQDPAGSPRCGLSSMNSHQMLLGELGAASGAGSAPPAGGTNGCNPTVLALMEESCSISDGPGDASLPGLLVVLLLVVAYRRRRRR